MLAGALAIFAAVAYLLLGWQGVASVLIGLVAGLVTIISMLIWHWATGRLRWPSN
jgi:hypothetical protein